ncbi:MAG: hypothetical protein LBS21_00200 [Clostridiales bacterium]|nr:hypothetical protein [Clostridiales bacterium]
MMEIKYAKHIDILFHVLAFMKVNNASNCYNGKYIDDMKLKRREFSGGKTLNNIALLEPYYNNNFDRLGIINFLPFGALNFDEMKTAFLNYPGFTREDLANFIIPFNEILDDESGFYFDFWESVFKAGDNERKAAETAIKQLFTKYKCVFDYCGKSALAYLSYSLTVNGRGYTDSKLTALAPFPKGEEQISKTFFTLWHEYTHQFTDMLLQRDINMRDGSHDISEIVVILTDFYLIKSIDPQSLRGYIMWLSADAGLSEGSKAGLSTGSNAGISADAGLSTASNAGLSADAGLITASNAGLSAGSISEADFLARVPIDEALKTQIFDVTKKILYYKD